MKGFLKMPAAEFAGWNAAATATYRGETGDETCTEYTFCTEDTDADFCWARVEHSFVEGDVKTKEEAINLGMVAPDVQAEI